MNQHFENSSKLHYTHTHTHKFYKKLDVSPISYSLWVRETGFTSQKTPWMAVYEWSLFSFWLVKGNCAPQFHVLITLLI